MVGSTEKPVNGGQLSLSVSLMGVPVFQTTMNNCDILKCPVAAGPISASLNLPASTVPPFAPAGEYTARAQAKSSSGEEIFCVEMKFTLPPAK